MIALLSYAATAIALLAVFAQSATAQATVGSGERFDSTAIELEDLGEIDVRTATVNEQRAFRIPAASFVLTSDDIRRSGARSVPEALRLVPGLDVAQVDGTAWSVAVRGFGNRANNQPLVIIDGRRVYSPDFGGIQWETEPMPIEDVARIEVMRGPGAVPFGSNAVNGVINIITRSARSEGLRVTAAPRYPGGGQSFVRFADRIIGRQFVRLWGQYDIDADESGRPRRAIARSQVGRAGFAADLRLSSDVDLEIDAAVSDGVIAEPRYTREQGSAPSTRMHRAFVIGRLEIEPRDSDAELNLRVVVDATRGPAVLNGGNFDVYEAEVDQVLPLGGRHEIYWGAGHRAMFHNEHRVQLSQAVLRDTVAITPTKLALTFGVRLAHHDSGMFVDPDMRWTWSPTARQTWWTAVSRASRPPSLLAAPDIDRVTPAEVQDRPPVATQLDQWGFGTRRVSAVETGYRIEPRSGIVIDTTAFINFYRDADRSLRLPVKGHTLGIESLVRWSPKPAWSVHAWYAANRADLAGHASSAANAGVNGSPTHRWQLRSRLTVRGMELDALVGRISNLLPWSADTYHHVDARIGRTFGALELSVAAGHLVNPLRMVYGGGRSRAPRTLTVKATWRGYEQ